MKYFAIRVLSAVEYLPCISFHPYCSIFSGLDRKSFDNKHVTFEDHIRKVHNMWNYVYFMVLIHVKDPTEYTGPESYVHEMIEVCWRLKFLHRKGTVVCVLAKASRLVSTNANK